MTDDPIQDEQLAILEGLLGRQLSAAEFEGFLIVGARFVDRFGNSRISELQRVFQTNRQEGRKALAASLSRVAQDLGSYDDYARAYPVTVVPPLPSYPLFPIIGIENIVEVVYRVLNSRSPAVAHIKSTGRLPRYGRPVEFVLRHTPKAHWCAYDKWDTPEETRESLQILPDWSDCEARAIIKTTAIVDLAYVPYSVNPNDPGTTGLAFHGYFFEGITQDHDQLRYRGDAVQICVYEDPKVAFLEEWDPAKRIWGLTWPPNP